MWHKSYEQKAIYKHLTKLNKNSKYFWRNPVLPFYTGTYMENLRDTQGN